ncbi:MAG TPA: NTP transferase domain-containing protein [Pirellulales bacterium]
MCDSLGIVEIRPQGEFSSSTPSRRLGGKSVLEWVVRGMTDCLCLSRIVVLAPNTHDIADLANLVPHNIPLFVSEGFDALARFADVVKAHPADAIVRIAAEHPFVDPELIDRLIATAARHPESDYIGYCSRNGQPAVCSPLGVIGEWIRTSALCEVDRQAMQYTQRQQVTAYLYAHPEEFNLRLIPIPAELDRDDLRLTIGGEEDWERTQTIFEALGSEPLDYRRMADLLNHQPALRQRMATLNRTIGAARLSAPTTTSASSLNV